MEITEKICSRCQESKGSATFKKDPRYKDGLASRCKDCDREYAREWREKNIEKERARFRAQYHADPEKAKLRRQADYQVNGDKRRAARLIYRANHLEEERARDRELRRKRKSEYPYLHKESDARSRAKEYGIECDKLDYNVIVERDGLTCHICLSLVDAKAVSFDHVIPLCKGGTHTYDNIKVSHYECNRNRNGRWYSESPCE